MKVIVCLDNHKGMMFNGRRVSHDRKVLEDIIKDLDGRKLYVGTYSEKLFEGYENLVVDDDFLDKSYENSVCFVEDKSLLAYKNKISSITVYFWNRDYPSDFKLDIDLECYKKVCEMEFTGNSHDKISKFQYERQ